MPIIRKQPVVRKLVSACAGNRCEYCRTPDDFVSAPFHIEHIQPTSDDGADETRSLAWACGFCNSSKSTKTQAEDPQTGEMTALFHPRHDNWIQHFAWDDADDLHIIGLSAVGRATIACLKMNRNERINMRRLLRLDGRHPPLDTPPDPAIP